MNGITIDVDTQHGLSWVDGLRCFMDEVSFGAVPGLVGCVPEPGDDITAMMGDGGNQHESTPYGILRFLNYYNLYKKIII